MRPSFGFGPALPSVTVGLMLWSAGVAFAQAPGQQTVPGAPGPIIDNLSTPGTTSGQAIPRADPEAQQSPPPPQGNVATSQGNPNLPPRQLTAEELEAVRKGMVDQTTGVMLKPGEIGAVRDRALGSQSAAQRSTYSNDPYPSAAPRVVTAAKDPMQTPPLARLAYGLTTPITFVDREGYPWPVANVTYNPRLFAQDGAGCGQGGSGGSGGGEARPASINLTPCYFEVFGNVNVALEEWPYPVVLLTQSGFRPGPDERKVVIDLPLTVVIDGRSPLAEKVKPLPIKVARKPQPIKKVATSTVSGDRDLAAYLTGSPPSSARAITLSGAPDVRGYLSGDRLVVVGPVDILAPAYNARATLPNGDTAYRFERAPVRLLIQDRKGGERSATVQF